MDVKYEFIQTQGYVDLKSDKTYVDNNIKNVNTKISNVVLDHQNRRQN